LPITYSEKNFRMAVCLAIFDADDKLLITRRPFNTGLFPHAWVLPGGHVDIGESLEDGATREIFEETGITI
jgi:8-oxo-dGTP diphosphatase